jgi:hypothetical protein
MQFVLVVVAAEGLVVELVVVALVVLLGVGHLQLHLVLLEQVVLEVLEATTHDMDI